MARCLTLRWMESRGDAIVTQWRITGRNARGVPRLGSRRTVAT